VLKAVRDPSPRQRAGRRTHLRRPHYSLAGSTLALLLGVASFTPSLAPRDWLWQGLVAGVSAAGGYLLGVLLAWVAGLVVRRGPSPTLRRRLWVALAAVGLPLVVWSLWQGQRWQRDLHLLMDRTPPESYEWVRILVLSSVVFVSLVAIGRGLAELVRMVTRRLVPLVPEPLAGPLAFLVVVIVLVTVNNGVFWRGLQVVANYAFGAANGGTFSWTTRPTTPQRSGTPGSLVSWESLGRQGREFVGSGPRAAELAAFSGEPAQEPVRVYVGLRSAGSTRDRAELAVQELRRAGAFEREVLVVATTTGTGFVDPAAAEAIEYMYNGDSAVVGIQYSYFPSFLSLTVDHELAEEAGRELFNRVHDAWVALPENRRPRLLVTGTSLGVFGSEAAFSGEADLRLRTDGVVWAGPPNFSALHSWFVENRDPGTPEWRPEYDDGRAIDFIGDPERGEEAPGEAEVVYLQNGSDPVVLWSPSLLFNRPDWLSEPRAPDVSPDMFWMPLVTFWQVSADLPSNYDVPAGHGHRYLELYVDGWVSVARPDGWTEQDSERLRVRLRTNQDERDRLVEAVGG
jgi:uncharacterized membrane protein